MMSEISHFCYMLMFAIIFVLSTKGTTGFFIKHVDTGKCIYDVGKNLLTYPTTGQSPSIRSQRFVETSDDCFDQPSQFNFRDTGAILKINIPGCLQAVDIDTSSNEGTLRLLVIHSDDKNNFDDLCSDNNAVTQASWGGLRFWFWRTNKLLCLVPATSNVFKNNDGVDPYLKTTDCNEGTEKRFHFGSVACTGQKIAKASCSSNQYMVIKVAEYRGLSKGSSCGSSYNYSCSVDVTCDLKNYCDGKRECTIIVDDNHFPSNICLGLEKYLYFEYQCIDTSMPYREICNFQDVSLSQSNLPNEGLVDIFTKYRNFTICNNGLLRKEKTLVCKHFGYSTAASLEGSMSLSSSMHRSYIPGNVKCDAQVNDLSQCAITQNSPCSQYSYVTCHICDRPLLNNTRRFPDFSFTASALTEGHSAANARISSGSSWCAPAATGDHYLQLNFEKLYAINTIAIFGDNTSPSWVASYYVNTTFDLTNWKSVFHKNSQKLFNGNKNAYNDAAISSITGGIRTKALRLIPIKYHGRPCLRTEVCGGELLPGQPTHLRVTSTTSRNAKVSWMSPKNVAVTPGTGVKNPLTNFRLVLKKKMMVMLNKTEPPDVARPYMFRHLIPNTMYTVDVFAGNSEGFGDPASLFFKTNEDVPDGPPLNVTIYVVGDTSLLITWEPPAENKRNGKIVNYTICIKQSGDFPCSGNFSTEDQSFRINDLKAATMYDIRVLASTRVGRGSYSEKQMAKTNTFSGSFNVPMNSTGKTLTFSFKIPSTKFKHFFVVAMEDDGQRPPSPSELKMENFVRYSATLSQPKPYIAAVLIPRDDGLFVLGDGSNTSVPRTRKRRSADIYYNGPLKANSSYRILQHVVINDKGASYSTDWSAVGRTTSEQISNPSPTIDVRKDDKNNSSVIIGTAVAVAFVLIIIFVIVMVLLRRKRGGKKEANKFLSSEDKRDKVQEMSVRNEMFDDDVVNNVEPPVKDNRDLSNPITYDEDTYANNESIAIRKHFPIPIANFTAHVKKLRQKNMQELKLEFEDLPNGQKCNWDIAKSPVNSSKNRYGNAVTYNHSRVILSGDEKKDYINASFIDGKRANYYIATQGPKPKTVNDFWRMIFEQKCPTIVMLTTLKEMGKVKCEKYWPDESNVYGEIQVTVTETKTFADYVTRMMVVEKNGEHHEVEHFHYKSWPDYGVPRYPTQLLTFRNHFKLSHKTRSSPVVVHCSAGVGRTGVFIALDKILDDLDDEYETNIDVFGFVEEMRSRRVNMVQTAEQYMFIHDAIIDHIQCGANEIDAVQIKAEIAQLSKKNRGGKTGFEEKFERLQSVTHGLPEELCEAALSEENSKKNRYPTIYPTETNRPTLRRVEHLATSDYINACFVDGYLGKNYFIATHMPLKATINDFWRMVTQYKCTTIVLLNQLTEDNKEYPMFWPTKRATSRPYGTCSVLFDSVVKKEDIVVRKLIASPSMDIKEGHMVHIIQYLSWPNHGVPKDVRSLLNVLSEVEEAQRSVEVKGPVVVVCSDGAGRSGTYITISNLVDRVKIVQVIDVFQCIKLIRNARPQFVETAEQFKLCYNAVSCVLESFDEYSNFTE